MPLDDQQKNALVNNFTILVRQVQTPGVEHQKLAMAFSMALNAIDPGQPIDLQSLFDYLTTEQKIGEKDVLELCVILKAREEKLGVLFTVPQKVQFLTAAQIDKTVNTFNARVDKQWEKKGPEATKSSASLAQTTWEPKKVKKGKPVNMMAVYGGMLLLCVVGAFAFYGWYFSTAQPPLVEVTMPAGHGGLACVKLQSDGATAICDIPKAVWQAGPEETLRAKAKLTRGATRAQGKDRLLVRIAESGKVVMSEK